MNKDDPGKDDDPPQPPGAAGVRAGDGPISQAIKLCVAALTRANGPDEIIAYMFATFGNALPACRITLFQNVGTEGHATTRCHAWHAEYAPPDTGSHAFAKLSNDLSIDAPRRLARGEMVVIDGATANDTVRQTLAGEGLTATILAPVFLDNTWWGGVEIDSCDAEHIWSRNEIGASDIFGSLIEAAIVRARSTRELAYAARIIENSSTVLFRFDAQTPHAINYISKNIEHYGYAPESLLATPHVLLELIHPEDIPLALDDIERVESGTAVSTNRDMRIKTGDGQYIWFDIRMTAVRDKSGRIAEMEGLAIDIDRRKATESYIVRFRLTDQLTGLPNRVAFINEVRHAFIAAKRGSKPFAILYIDLDHFKDINDVLGHSKGDALLKFVAMRLQGAVRNGDIVARLGGDEFAILQLDIADPSDAGALASRVLRDLAHPPYDLGTQVEITASIGIAFSDHNVTEPEEMIKHADMALYRAKDAGRNQFHFHSEALDIAIIERVTLAADLRLGLERGEFELYYQPQVDVETNRIVGVEALTRWRHPKLGLLQPGHFIAVAEKSGTIFPLGRWIIEQVCRQICAWRADGLAPPRVGLNVSAVQINGSPDFDAELMHILHDGKVDPSSIALELTESVLMATTREHRDVIDRLNRVGVAISIDDFGTGYSSLGYLRSFRVSQIKIAQEFVSNIAASSGDIAIVRAAISLARELGISVVAEGVETAYQLDLLKEAGCRCVQGFYFSQPLPPDQLTPHLRRGTINAGEQIRANGPDEAHPIVA